MTDKLWVEQLSVLFKPSKLAEFWPSKYHSHAERINALSRFCLYSGIIVAVAKRDMRYFAYAICTVALLGVSYELPSEEPKAHVSKVTKHMFPNETVGVGEEGCVKAMENNPFSNFLNFDSVSKSQPCVLDEGEMRELYRTGMPDDHFDLYGKNDGYGRFFTMPNTQVVHDQNLFAQWAYGGSFSKCKEDHTSCTGFEGLTSGAGNNPKSS